MSEHRTIRIAGWLGLLASILVGIAEFSMQYTPNGGLDDLTHYAFFNDISDQRLSFGHFLAVLAAPLYVVGYWFLSKQLEPAGDRLSRIFFWVGAYAFMVGTAWIGQRFFLGATVHAIAAGEAAPQLLTTFAKHNEPFVNVLRLAMLIVSIIWVRLILSGNTAFPKWMAVFSPILLLAVVFGLYFAGTTIGLFVFPIAMNATHFIIFALALWTTRQTLPTPE